MSDPFEKERDKQLALMERAELAAVQAVTAKVNQLRSDVVARIAEAGDLKGRVATMRHVEATIRQQTASFERDAVELIGVEIDKAFKAGVELVDAPLAKLGIQSQIVGTSQEVLTTAKAFSADLIQNLTADARIRINSILRQAALGAISTQEAIDAVGRSLDSPGVFKGIAARAETIVRTETLRIYSQAAQARMSQRATALEQAGFAYKKAWLTAEDLRVRPSHIVAGVQYAEGIPIDEPFIVGGEKLMYPRDETASAEETVNCRCSSVPVVMKAAA
jgi:hypothetical protein